MKNKFGIGFGVISIFYFLMAFFYFFFGMFFTGFLFDFGGVMGGSDLFVSDFVTISSSDISEELVVASSPVFSFLLYDDIFYTGLVMIFLSFVIFLAGVGLWGGNRFAILFAILFSSYEIFVVSFFLEPRFFSLVPHFITHLTIIFYSIIFYSRGK